MKKWIFKVVHNNFLVSQRYMYYKNIKKEEKKLEIKISDQLKSKFSLSI